MGQFLSVVANISVFYDFINFISGKSAVSANHGSSLAPQLEFNSFSRNMIIDQTWKSAAYVRIDCADLDTFFFFFLKDHHGKINFDTYVLEACTNERKPIFFHLDELGDFDVYNLRLLRNACWRALTDCHLGGNCFPFLAVV